MRAVLVYAGGMAQLAHNYDSAAFDIVASVGRAVDEAENGQVIYLNRRDQRSVAVMPAELAEAALEALEDAQDVETARAIMAGRASGEIGVMPHEEVLALFAADLEDTPAQ